MTATLVEDGDIDDDVTEVPALAVNISVPRCQDKEERVPYGVLGERRVSLFASKSWLAGLREETLQSMAFT